MRAVLAGKTKLYSLNVCERPTALGKNTKPGAILEGMVEGQSAQ